MPSAATTIETDQMSARLEGKTVGLSISDNADRTTRGFDRIHQNTFMYKVAQALYRCGASISYGGHLRNEGFTSTSLQYLVDEQQSTIEDQRIQSYVAWPLYCGDAISQDGLQDDFLKFAEIIELPAPDEYDGPKFEFLDSTHIPNRYYWFRSLTELRRKMNAEIHARVVLGGKTRGFVGRYPGIVEEVLFAVSTKSPLYVCGGFGGAAFALAQLFLGKTATDLDSLSQYADEQYAATASYYEASTALKLRPFLNAITPFDRFVGYSVDYPLLCDFFREVGVGGLNNGLSPQENEILFETPSLDEIRTLVLTGLTRLFAVSQQYKSPCEETENRPDVVFERAIRHASQPRSPLIYNFQTFALEGADELLTLESELFQVFGDRYRDVRQRVLQQTAPTICEQFSSVSNSRSLLSLDLASLSWAPARGDVPLIADFFSELSKVIPAIAGCDAVRRHLPTVEAPSVTETTTRGEGGESTNAGNGNALNLWLQKLAYFEEQQAILSDPAQKFDLLKKIEEASAKIKELGG